MKTLKMILFLMAFGLTTNAQNIDLQKGLLGYWPFNGNSKDASGNNLNAVQYGSSFVNAKFGQGIQFSNKSNSGWFDKKDYVVLPKISFDDFSLSLWVKFNKANNYDAGAAIFSVGDNSSKYFILFCNSNSGDLYFSYNGTESNKYNINDNKWHFINVIKSSGNISIYIDGSKFDSKSISNFYFTNQPAYFSYHQWYNGSSGSSRFYGVLDEVRLYNRAISNTESQALFNNEFNDVSGGEIAENSINNNNISTSNYTTNYIDKKEVNLLIPFSKEYYKIDKPDLSKYEVSIIKKQSKKGDLASLVTYGDMFYYGYDKIERNEVEAILIYKKAADQGNALAQYKLATIYKQNTATVSDAIKYYNMAVEQNYEPAIYDLAILYLNGSGGISKDYSKAKELLQKIPSNMKAKTELGKLYLSSDITTFNLKGSTANLVESFKFGTWISQKIFSICC